jgi:EAL domain-containing protein (putative c-di-GMP-specific phosphodiesterase class I)
MTQCPDKTLLILDDDEAVSLTLRLISEREGFAVHAAADAQAFFQALHAQSPGHVIVDLMMPGHDGLQVLHRLAQENYSGEVIVCSGLDRRVLEAAGRTALSHGLRFAGILPKPFLPRQLRQLLGHSDAVVEPSPPDSLSTFTQADLAEAIERRWLVPYFQPKIRCADRTLCGFEVLSRIHHPERGVIPPDVFIPLAERIGLVTPLTLQMLEASLAWLSTSPHPGCELAINLSRRSTYTKFAESLIRLCGRYGIPPKQIILEVTETAQHDDASALLEFLTRFRIQGFQLSLDDFGVGYSSLTELARLPFSEIKIDRVFVGSVTHSTESQKICAAIIGLGKALGLTVTAEGVESRAALDILGELGCDRAQGYFISRPMPAAQASVWLPDLQA